MPPLDSTDVQLLTQIGFIAAGRGDVLRSQRIFSALALLRPHKAFPHIGMACAWMNANQAMHAAQYLSEQNLPAGEDADLLDAFLALTLQIAGHTRRSQYMLDQLLQRTSSQPMGAARRMALSMLGQLPTESLTSTAMQESL